MKTLKPGMLLVNKARLKVAVYSSDPKAGTVLVAQGIHPYRADKAVSFKVCETHAVTGRAWQKLDLDCPLCDNRGQKAEVVAENEAVARMFSK